MANPDKSNQGDFIDRVIAVWNRRNVEEVDSLIADDGAYEVPALQRLHVVPSGEAPRHMSFIIGLSSDFRYERRDSMVQGDRHFFEWELSGTNDLAYDPLGIVASGKTFSVLGATLLVTENGKIKRGANYFDLWGAFTQIGLPQSGPFAWPLEAWMLEREQERPAPIE
jgi:steroid delta-isomerase-like uncharacterized protein